MTKPSKPMHMPATAYGNMTQVETFVCLRWSSNLNFLVGRQDHSLHADPEMDCLQLVCFSALIIAEARGRHD